MPADLVTRLWLESKGFDRNIGQAIGYLNRLKKEAKEGGDQVTAFGRRMDSSIGNLGSILSAGVGTLGKFAGGIGLAMSGVEALGKALNSNAELQGKYNDLMKAGSTVIDQFFSSLYSGDWTVFNQGILKAIENAERFQKSYRNTMRMLETTRVKYERVDAEKNRLESIIEDDTKSLAERKKAQAELDKLLIMGIADIREASGIVNQTLNNMIKDSVGSGAKYVNSENAQDLINQLYNPFTSLSRDLATYREERDSTQGMINFNFLNETGDEYYERLMRERDEFNKKYTTEEKKRNDELLRLQESLTNETYASYREMFDQINDLSDKAWTWEKDRTGAKDEIISATTSSSSSGSSVKVKTTLVAEEVQLPQTTVTALQSQLAEVTSLSFPEPTENLYGNMDLSEINAQLQEFKSTLPEGGIQLISTQGGGADQYLNGIASMLTAINTLTGEGAAGWIQWAASVMSAVAQAIPAITAVTTAQTAQAAAGAAASVASIPVVGWIMAGAAVASVIAAIASAKFAQGGIVPGGSFVGDRVPILANSGEMILTKGQQANLFRILSDGGGSGGGLNVSGELIGRGDALIATIRSTERKKSRMR